MESSLYLEIRNWLSRYLAAEIDLAAFDNWFVPATWNVDQEGDQDAIELAHQVTHLLAEYSNGDWTEGELKDQVRPLISGLFARLDAPGSSVSASSGSQWAFVITNALVSSEISGQQSSTGVPDVQRTAPRQPPQVTSTAA